METPRPGSWDRARSRHDASFRAHVEAHLGAFARQAIPPGDRRPAAVAAVLLPDDEGRATFLLTRRAPGLRAHERTVGVAGRPDRWGGERLLQAALRELAEEVGLDARRDRGAGQPWTTIPRGPDSWSLPSSCGPDRPSYSAPKPGRGRLDPPAS